MTVLDQDTTLEVTSLIETKIVANFVNIQRLQ